MWKRAVEALAQNETYLITGASGYIGSMLIKKLQAAPEYQQGRLKVIGLLRGVPPPAAGNLRFVQADIEDSRQCLSVLQSITPKPDYIIHCAAPTRSAFIASHPVETLSCIVQGTRNILELARIWAIKSAVYLSSMEVYGHIDCADGRRVGENELGTVPLFDARSSYPLGKRAAEQLCFAYWEEYRLPVKIARLAQTFGAGIRPGENRVFAQFADAVRQQRDIVLHTTGSSVGNYCGIDDVLNAILLLLKQGRNGEAYNVVNEKNTMTVREMAVLVAESIAGGKIKVRYEIPEGNPYGYAAETGLRMSAAKLERLGWRPEASLAAMYRCLIRYMEETQMQPIG